MRISRGGDGGKPIRRADGSWMDRGQLYKGGRHTSEGLGGQGHMLEGGIGVKGLIAMKSNMMTRKQH